MSATVAEVTAALEAAYPPELAENWDAIGLACGDPAAPVRRVLVCVDPVAETIAEAIALNAQLIVAHHPLLLRGVHTVSTSTSKGELIHTMIQSGIALYCAHTNADAADPGVSDALAAAIGLKVQRPLTPHESDHAVGIGRIGVLAEPESLADFVARVGAALPRTEPGVVGAGDPDRMVRTVAVSGGAGDSYLNAATAAGVDAYVTADLRHHPAGEHLAGRDAPALVGVTHWASEWPWCAQAAGVITAALPGTVETTVSTIRTDPWKIRAAT